MHLHAIPPHKVQKSPPLNVQSYKRSLVTSLVETPVRLLTTCCVYEDYCLITTSLRFLRLFRALRA